jgi:hypothetical protein
MAPSSAAVTVPKRPKLRATCQAMRSEIHRSAVRASSPNCQSARPGVRARVEVGRALEVVLGLGRVGDLPAHARQAEHAQGAALVRVAQDVELAALEQQVVGVHLARAELVALHRVVVERDRLVAEDRGLDLREAVGELVAARAARDAERDGALVGRAQRRRAPPGDLLQRQAQGLGVGELPVQERQRGLQRGQLASVNAIAGRWKFSGRRE